MFMDPFQETSVGVPASPEALSCVVSEDGSSSTIDIVESPYEIAVTNQQSWYATETQTITLSCGSGSSAFDVSATATASAQSFVSLANAQQQAIELAAQAASAAAQNYRQQNPC